MSEGARIWFQQGNGVIDMMMKSPIKDYRILTDVNSRIAVGGRDNYSHSDLLQMTHEPNSRLVFMQSYLDPDDYYDENGNPFYWYQGDAM